MNRKHILIASLINVVLMTVVFTPLSGQEDDTYDPWLDYNDDGTVDVNDLSLLGQAYGTSGDTTKNVSVTNWPVDEQGRVINFVELTDYRVMTGVVRPDTGDVYLFGEHRSTSGKCAMFRISNKMIPTFTKVWEQQLASGAYPLGAIVTPQGNLLVSFNAAGMYRSTDWTTFSVVASGWAAIDFKFAYDVVNGRLLAGVWSGSPVKRVMKSEDDGATWAEHVDLSSYANNHIHGICYDRKGGRIWVTAGDGVGNSVITMEPDGSDIVAVKDTRLQDYAQYVGIMPVSEDPYSTDYKSPTRYGVRAVILGHDAAGNVAGITYMPTDYSDGKSPDIKSAFTVAYPFVTLPYSSQDHMRSYTFHFEDAGGIIIAPDQKGYIGVTKTAGRTWNFIRMAGHPWDATSDSKLVYVCAEDYLIIISKEMLFKLTEPDEQLYVLCAKETSDQSIYRGNGLPTSLFKDMLIFFGTNNPTGTDRVLYSYRYGYYGATGADGYIMDPALVSNKTTKAVTATRDCLWTAAFNIAGNVSVKNNLYVKLRK